MKPKIPPGRTASQPCLVKVETWSHDGLFLRDCDFQGEFESRDAAIDAIDRHLAQFERSGYDEEKDCWWARSSSSSPQQELRFRII